MVKKINQIYVLSSFVSNSSFLIIAFQCQCSDLKEIVKVKFNYLRIWILMIKYSQSPSLLADRKRKLII